ncbi:nucleoid protein MC1 [Halogranum rubrum]|uniref:Nucleoid protein MC1 n=2 Tax=Halogranum rubrum TaxID=553466 RepID=A0A1I4H710_9EURY|nr:nucleoid protein MC1 [Halogranum rubrum]
MWSLAIEGKIMVRDDGKRNFALRESNGDESSVFSGNTPRQAALKAARRLEPGSSEEETDRVELRLREKGTDKVHIYEGWAWHETSPDNKPDWMPDTITEANVSKKGIEHLEE